MSLGRLMSIAGGVVLLMLGAAVVQEAMDPPHKCGCNDPHTFENGDDIRHWGGPTNADTANPGGVQ